MLLKETLKGEHFVIGGDTLYRRTEGSYHVVAGKNEWPTEDTEVKIINPWVWFANKMKRKYI